MSDRIFFYGTLLSGEAPENVSKIVRELRSLGGASVRGRLYDLGHYPGALLDLDAGSLIRGEAFETGDVRQLLQSLDDYEGFDPSDPVKSLFVRSRTMATLDGGERVECWIYVFNGDPGETVGIPGGDYLLWRSQRRGDP